MNTLLFRQLKYWSCALAVVTGLVSCSKKSPTEPTPPLPVSQQISAFGSLPRWSPDGHKLVFGGTGSHPGLWIYDSQADTVYRILDGSHPQSYDYRWSAGSNKIAFSGPGATIDSTSGIFTLSADGSSLFRWHTTGHSPDWIPDGTGLVFAENNPQSGGNGLGIFKLLFSDTTVTPLTSTGYDPQVNPQSTLAAYRDPVIAGGETVTYRLRVVSINGTSNTMLSDSCLQFDWTGDGLRLVFDYSLPGLGYRIASASATGGSLATLILGADEPSVSSGGRVAYHSVAGDLSQGIYAINLDGSNNEALAAQGAQPDITSDGSKVAYLNAGGIWVVNP